MASPVKTLMSVLSALLNVLSNASIKTLASQASPMLAHVIWDTP